jgi:hypothetical protein
MLSVFLTYGLIKHEYTIAITNSMTPLYTNHLDMPVNLNHPIHTPQAQTYHQQL